MFIIFSKLREKRISSELRSLGEKLFVRHRTYRIYIGNCYRAKASSHMSLNESGFNDEIPTRKRVSDVSRLYVLFVLLFARHPGAPH